MFCWTVKMLITDSGAIKVINSQEILIGVGNHVKYVKYADKQTTVDINTEFRNKVLGIEVLKLPEGIVAFIYGGRYLAAYQIVEESVRKIAGCIFTDQISSIHCETDCENICVVTGHNLALLVSLKEEFSIMNKAKCEDNSTLYCSHVVGKNWEDFLVYSGTALGDVIVWKPNNAERGILHRFTAHKGVVFSITTDEDLLVTTSDDRSAKIWQKDENHKVSKSVTLFGHKSRVFRSKIVKKNDKKFIVTVGEDSNVTVWHDTGKFIFRKALYSGAVIWNLDYDVETESLLICGSDGNVKRLELSEILTKSLDVSPRKAVLDEKISKILFIDSEKILVLASEMFLLKLKPTGEWITFERKPLPDLYISHIENIKGRILICSYHEARIYKVSEDSIEEELKNDKLLEGLIRTFYQISADEFFFVDDQGNCAITDKSLTILNKFSLSLCKDFWYTKWITIAKKISDYLVFGDRMGHLYLAIISSGQVEIKCCTKSVHGNLGVTQISLEEISKKSATFWTSGRDGYLRLFILDSEKETLKEIFTEKVPISWVERIMPMKCGRKFILGFNDENLIVWEKNEGVVLQLCTGGGHKYWDFVMNPTQSTASIISVWDKKPFIDKFPLPNKSVNALDLSSNNWHHKSCNSLRILKDSSETIFLASGGDDNTLRINVLDDKRNNLIPVSEVVTHISNIRAMDLLECPENDRFLVVSVGGRAQMCITKILLKEQPKVQEFINYMLKSRDFVKNRINQMIDFCPETRFMCLAINELDIFVGCSDGYIRKFSFQMDKIVLISSVFYGRCILNVKIIEHSRKKVLLTMGTDGKLIFWDLNNFFDNSLPFIGIQHHESGINCFDMLQEEDGITILTGGDDQKISKSVFLFKEEQLIQKQPTTIASLHFAQVTGLKIANRDTFFSTSVDQRIIKGSMSELSILDEKFTSVSDLKGVELLNDKCVIVFGAGVEMIQF